MKTPFNLPNNSAKSRNILKNWVKEPAWFRLTPNNIYKTKIFRKVYQYLVIFSYRLYGQTSTETFPLSWAIALDQLAREGKPCNWSGILAHQLKEQVMKARQSPWGTQVEIYMYTYILDAICAWQEFPGLEWPWSPAETVVNTYCKLLPECSFRGVIARLFDHFVTPVYKLIFK